MKLFNKFRECKTKEEQSTSEELAEHANKVMETLDEGIRGLDDLDSFFDYLHQVGASHTRIPGFKAEYFWVSNFDENFDKNRIFRPRKRTHHFKGYFSVIVRELWEKLFLTHNTLLSIQKNYFPIDD